tara:strand:+ start:151 stop:345 length:195 start_codon:yes stop_codon:yes gene_type:complete
MINKNTLFVKSTGKTKNYVMTLFNFNEAKSLLNKTGFKIIRLNIFSISNFLYYLQKLDEKNIRS